jgi:hypothetical protein
MKELMTLRVDLLPGMTSTETLERVYGENWQKVIEPYDAVQFLRDGVDAGTFFKGLPTTNAPDWTLVVPVVEELQPEATIEAKLYHSRAKPTT